MNNKIDPKAFRESMDRCYSGVRGDPFLAGRIIASEKAGTSTGRRFSVRFVLILAALVILATAAVAGMELARSTVWSVDGEMHEFTVPEIYEEKPDTYPGMSVSREELNNTLSIMISEIPDDEYAVAWYEYSMDGVNTTKHTRTHNKIKTFTSFGEFREYMANVEYLTIPSWLPEDVGEEDFYAEIQFGLQSEEDDKIIWDDFEEKNEKAQLIEERTEGDVHLRRYHFDEADEIIKGYTVSVYSESLGALNAHGEVSTYGTVFTIEDDRTTRPAQIPGMDHALLVISPNPEWPTPHELLMRRNLDSKTLFGKDVEAEEIVYAATDGSEPECMLKMFAGE